MDGLPPLETFHRETSLNPEKLAAFEKLSNEFLRSCFCRAKLTA